MPNLTGYRVLDANGHPIDSTNPLQVQTVGGGSAVDISTITASNPMPVSFSKDPLTITVNVGTMVGINTSTATNPIIC